MGKLGVQQFNVKFNSLSYRVEGLSEPILMDYYQRALSERVCQQAMGRPDWGPCRTTKALQVVTLLASKQLDNISSANRPVFPQPPISSATVPVPRESSAMDVDIHAATARFSRSPVPLVVSFGFYRELCHQRGLCWRCLKGYDEAHRTRKMSPTQSPCPNLPVDSTQMDRFAAQCQTQPLPPPVSRPPPQTAAMALSPVPESSGGLSYPQAMASSLTASPYGVQAFYHTPPHLFHTQPIFSSYPPYPVAPPALPVPTLPSAPSEVHPAPVEVAPPSTTIAAIASSFSEYEDLDTPRYYDLPSGSSSDPADAGFWSFDNEDSSPPRCLGY